MNRMNQFYWNDFIIALLLSSHFNNFIILIVTLDRLVFHIKISSIQFRIHIPNAKNFIWNMIMKKLNLQLYQSGIMNFFDIKRKNNTFPTIQIRNAVIKYCRLKKRIRIQWKISQNRLLNKYLFHRKVIYTDYSICYSMNQVHISKQSLFDIDVFLIILLFRCSFCSWWMVVFQWFPSRKNLFYWFASHPLKLLFHYICD